jgi:hypothetical protein
MVYRFGRLGLGRLLLQLLCGLLLGALLADDVGVPVWLFARPVLAPLDPDTLWALCGGL